MFTVLRDKLENRTKVQTIRPAWTVSDLSLHTCPDAPYCDCKKEYVLLDKPPRYKVGQMAKIEGWWIGWDYAHLNDFVGYNIDTPIRSGCSDRKWTTQEIKDEVFDVIKQLKDMKQNYAL